MFCYSLLGCLQNILAISLQDRLLVTLKICIIRVKMFGVECNDEW
jgi:hypothetical protein